jgi:hypothetical protein
MRDIKKLHAELVALEARAKPDATVRAAPNGELFVEWHEGGIDRVLRSAARDPSEARILFGITAASGAAIRREGEARQRETSARTKRAREGKARKQQPRDRALRREVLRLARDRGWGRSAIASHLTKLGKIGRHKIGPVDRHRVGRILSEARASQKPGAI